MRTSKYVQIYVYIYYILSRIHSCVLRYIMVNRVFRGRWQVPFLRITAYFRLRPYIFVVVVFVFGAWQSLLLCFCCFFEPLNIL